MSLENRPERQGKLGRAWGTIKSSERKIREELETAGSAGTTGYLSYMTVKLTESNRVTLAIISGVVAGASGVITVLQSRELIEKHKRE